MDIVIDNTSKMGASERKRRRTREDWKALVNAWESSNQTQQAFCQKHGLCYRQFSQWKSRFKSEHLIEAQSDETQFVPIQTQSPVHTQASGVQVYLPNGIRLEISNEHHLPVLVNSAKALMALSC